MKKILVIEDHENLRKEVCDWFIFEGFEVYQASDGISGTAVAMQKIPDLILCDIMMPGSNGHEVLQALKNNPSTSMIPFIFMTALAERSQVRSGMEGGADDYITKPFTREELLQAVGTRLGKSEELHSRSQAALQELRMNLITSLPHELNTPLNGILGFAQLLKNHPESFSHADLSKIGESVHTSALRLHRLVQNYLLFAQLELKKTGLDKEFYLDRTAEVISRAARKKAEQMQRPDDLELNLSKAVAFVPELEFMKIIEELADNAFKFSKPGQKVRISSGFADNRFILRIEDHGIGIRAEDIHRIGAFMQFERMMNEQQGFGLGLIISKRIVELFNGAMSFEGGPGLGTIVTIRLKGKESQD